MITPIYIIILSLGTAFLTAILSKKSEKLPFVMLFTAIMSITAISAYWAFRFIAFKDSSMIESTAGFSAPLSIALKVGIEESFALLVINLTALLGMPHIFKLIKENGKYSAITYLLYFMALNGIVMTRDLFNYFVFIEISSIAVAGMLLFQKSGKLLKAGFSWLVATGIISIFLILGAITAYVKTGVLDIDTIVLMNSSGLGTGSIAAFFLFIALIFELKPFPANRWAVDIYKSAPAGITAAISGAGMTASLFALYKFLPVLGSSWNAAVAMTGLLTFVMSNLLAIKTENTNKMLGLSSIAQGGLATAVIGLGNILGTDTFFIAGTIVAVHAVSKTGLFWLNGIAGFEKTKEWGKLKGNPFVIFLLGLFIFSLLGLPPFPTFFAKWMLIEQLAGTSNWLWMALILIGSLLEAVYLIRWFGYSVKMESDTQKEIKFKELALLFVSVAILFIISIDIPFAVGHMPLLKTVSIPLIFATSFFILDFLPAKIKNILLISGLGYYFYHLYPVLFEFRAVFLIVFLIGGMILLLAGFDKSGKRVGFYPSSALMYAGLAGLLTANTTMEFFFWWELMTLGSYFLILRGKKSMAHALSYMTFSLGGAYSMLAGFGLISAANNGNLELATLSTAGAYQSVIFILLVIGFLTKTAAAPLHIWLPGAHSEAESDVSPVVSAVLLKAGVFGLIVTMLAMGPQSFKGVNIYYVLGWLGVITALLGNMMAAFEEDAKRLLAYSSVGQLGGVVFALSMMNHLGWLTATAFALNHFVFKALLFLAIGGVVMRVKTRNMYEMGGLITRMPISFLSVMIGIIALSGVPPLTGFGGKWLSYNAMIDSQMYFQGAVASFAGLVAFLYCFRLIFAIFLGQLKDNHRHVKEAPFWMLVPQFALLGLVMFFSVVPGVALKPIGEFLVKYFPENPLVWDGYLAKSYLGYWDGKMIMYVTMGIFSVVFAWLFFINRKAVKVKQFNIVYAAERPSRPELTHFAYNFFAPYRKALGFLVTPLATAFWNGVSEGFHSTATFTSKIFKGNSQSYAIHILLYAVISFIITFGGVQ